MSIEAVGDILVHLSKVQNYDCFTFGNYKVKMEVWRRATLPVERVPALPYLMPPKPFDDARVSKLRNAHIDDKRNCYVSQTFLFRSSNESVR